MNTADIYEINKGKISELYYNVINKEIVAVNYDVNESGQEKYAYSYVFALPKEGNNTISIYKKWSKYYNILNNFPIPLGTDKNGNTIIEIGNENENDNGSQNIFVQTNSINLASYNFQKITRAICQCRITGLGGEETIGIYMFASNDGFVWALSDAIEVAGSNNFSGTPDHKKAFKNFNPLKNTLSAKYAIFIIAGKMNKRNDSIYSLLMEIEASAIANKIR